MISYTRPDIRYPAFRRARNLAKSVFGAFLISVITLKNGQKYVIFWGHIFC